MKKTSKKHLVLKRDTLKALTVLPSTVYRHVVGGTNLMDSRTCPTKANKGGMPPL